MRKTYGPLKAKNCAIGVVCGGTCISRNKSCLVNLSAKQKASVSKAAVKIVPIAINKAKPTLPIKVSTQPKPTLPVKADTSIDNYYSKKKANKEKVLNKFKDFGKKPSILTAKKFLESLIDSSNTPPKDYAISGGTAAEQALIKSYVKDFYAISGNNAIAFSSITLAEGRSYNDNGNITIDLRNKKGIREDLFHELGHSVEFKRKTTADKAKEFLVSASKNKTDSLRNLTNLNYPTEQIAYVGKFVDPYVGRIYPGKNAGTEVVSTGYEHLSSPQKVLELFNKSPEHFYFMADIIGAGDYN